MVSLAEALVHAALSAAFDLVADPDDWKAPIDAVVTLPHVMDGLEVKKAVQFFTATEATISVVGLASETDITVRVQAPGYRMGPAGDC